MLTARVYSRGNSPICEHATHDERERSLRFEVDRHESGAIIVNETVIFEITEQGDFRVLVGDPDGLRELYSSNMVTA